MGRINTLTIVKEVDFGMYLDGGEEGEILLPKRYVPANAKPGQQLDVFVYLDNEERPVATTETPLGMVGDIVCLEVAWVNEYGAFLNWGLMKDLFCPFREQKMRMQVGERHLVHIHIDEESFRIVASAKIEKYLQKGMPPFQKGQEVQLMAWQHTEMGLKVVVENAWSGLIFKNKVYPKVTKGTRLNGYVELVREDGKLDISLQKPGQAAVEDFAEVLLQYMKTHNGHCPLGDKSDAADIFQTFNVSKKVFKKAVGDLYKRRLITVEPTAIKLAE